VPHRPYGQVSITLSLDQRERDCQPVRVQVRPLSLVRLVQLPSRVQLRLGPGRPCPPEPRNRPRTRRTTANRIMTPSFPGRAHARRGPTLYRYGRSVTPLRAASHQGRRSPATSPAQYLAPGGGLTGGGQPWTAGPRDRICLGRSWLARARAGSSTFIAPRGTSRWLSSAARQCALSTWIRQAAALPGWVP
jgi:hypothetical protein